MKHAGVQEEACTPERAQRPVLGADSEDDLVRERIDQGAGPLGKELTR